METPRDKERLQVLFWLKQEKPPSIGAIAKALGKHRNTVGVIPWASVIEVPGGRNGSDAKTQAIVRGVRKISQWA